MESDGIVNEHRAFERTGRGLTHFHGEKHHHLML